jgi:hypothetical protein
MPPLCRQAPRRSLPLRATRTRWLVLGEAGPKPGPMCMTSTVPRRRRLRRDRRRFALGDLSTTAGSFRDRRQDPCVCRTRSRGFSSGARVSPPFVTAPQNIYHPRQILCLARRRKWSGRLCGDRSSRSHHLLRVRGAVDCWWALSCAFSARSSAFSASRASTSPTPVRFNPAPSRVVIRRTRARSSWL